METDGEDDVKAREWEEESKRKNKKKSRTNEKSDGAKSVHFVGLHHAPHRVVRNGSGSSDLHCGSVPLEVRLFYFPQSSQAYVDTAPKWFLQPACPPSPTRTLACCLSFYRISQINLADDEFIEKEQNKETKKQQLVLT